MMASRYDRKRLNVEGDRLSSLPDDLIHKILSFIDIKHAIETSALSSRWRYIWTSMPCLNFSNKGFHTFSNFSKFITCVMSGRNNQVEVSSIQLTFHRKLTHPHAKRILNIILNYKSTHNVQQLNISNCSYGKMESPLCYLSFQTLKHLSLIGCTYKYPITTIPTWELLTLATLILHRVTFYADSTADNSTGLFSNFANLKNLTIKNCRIMGLNDFNIHHPRLSNLTLEEGIKAGNVVTPQLKNLAIRYWKNTLTISAPHLASLLSKDTYYPLQLTSDLLHLEKADICISHPPEDKENTCKIVCLLQQLRSVKFLTLNFEIVKLLSSYMELISRRPSPFANLKSLKIYPANVSLEKQKPKVTMSNEVKWYLLDGSSGATLTTVSHEEIRAVKNVTSARNLIGELHRLLEQWKQNSETNATDMKQEKAPMESHTSIVPEQAEAENQLGTNMKLHFWERMMHINHQYKKGYKNTDRALSMLREIERVLKRLPTSHQAKLQVSFASLCAEVATIMDIMVDHFKIECDKKPRLHFHELATASQPSS